MGFLRCALARLRARALVRSRVFNVVIVYNAEHADSILFLKMLQTQFFCYTFWGLKEILNHECRICLAEN